EARAHHLPPRERSFKEGERSGSHGKVSPSGREFCQVLFYRFSQLWRGCYETNSSSARRTNVATRRSALAAVGPGAGTARLGLKPGAVTAGALAPGHYSPGRAHFHRFRVPPCGMKTRLKMLSRASGTNPFSDAGGGKRSRHLLCHRLRTLALWIFSG